MKLFEPYDIGKMKLKNRIVMAPLTRCRAIGNTANELMKTYYQQRSSAGLIITEGTSPSPNGLGYARIPGMFNKEQSDSWRQVTSAVHEQGGKIFMQLMHCGRISHRDNMPTGTKILAPSAVKPNGEMWTDSKGLQTYDVPNAMSLEEIKSTIAEFVKSAELAIDAGFDGVELHGANGYLIEQFLNPKANLRTDEYGGNSAGRMKFALDIAKAVAAAIGSEKTGIRLSPHGIFGDLSLFEDIDTFYSDLATRLGQLHLAYIHLVDHSSLGTPEVPVSLKKKIQINFSGTIILSGGFEAERANHELDLGNAELIAFGRPFISNPQLPAKMKDRIPLAMPDAETFYTADAKGYTDY